MLRAALGLLVMLVAATAAAKEFPKFEDLPSMEEKIVAAKAHGGRGVTYWTLGDELPGYFELARKHFP